MPAWLPSADSAEYQELTPQSNYATAADAAVYDPPGWYSGSGSNFEIVIGSAIAGVLNGQLSVDQAITQMHDKLDVLADTDHRSDPSHRIPTAGGAPVTTETSAQRRSGRERVRPTHRERATTPRPVASSFSPRSSSSICSSSSARRSTALVMSFFDTSLVKPGLGEFAGLGNYAEALGQLRLLVVAVAHHLVHDPDHAAAGRAGLRARAAGRPGRHAADGSSGWPSSRRTSCRRPSSR